MVTMFEEAYKQQPGNEEFAAQTFFANVRAGHWKSAQQVSILLPVGGVLKRPVCGLNEYGRATTTCYASHDVHQHMEIVPCVSTVLTNICIFVDCNENA